MSSRGTSRGGSRGAYRARRALLAALAVVAVVAAAVGAGIGVQRTMAQISANTATEGETLRLENGQLAVIVDDRGRFTMGGVRPVNSLADERRAKTTEGPDYEELLAGFPAGFANSGLLIADEGDPEKALRFGQDGEVSALPRKIDDQRIETTYTYADGLRITQTIELREASSQATISYEIRNSSDSDRNLRARLLMDTLRQSPADSTISVPGGGEIGEPTSIKATRLPYVLAIRSEAAGFTNAYGDLRGEGPSPDVVQVGEAATMREQGFGYKPGTEPEDVGEGAYGLLWKQIEIPAGESKTISHSYGLPPGAEQGSLGASAYE